MVTVGCSLYLHILNLIINLEWKIQIPHTYFFYIAQITTHFHFTEANGFVDVYFMYNFLMFNDQQRKICCYCARGKTAIPTNSRKYVKETRDYCS